MDCDNDKKYDPSILPKTKNETRKVVRSGKKEMIINLGSEGVSSPNRIKWKEELFDKLNDIQLHSIRQKVHSFWFRREIPTLEKIFKVINNDPELVNISRLSLHSLLIKLKFTFIKKKKLSVLTEKGDLIIRRRNYLHDVRKFREQGRPIYYLDETWINANDCCDTVCHGITVESKRVKVNPTSKGLIVFHIGSDKGFLPGGLLYFESNKNAKNFHDDISSENFKKWFELILPKLERNSVIVMDNMPHHSEKLERTPTTYWKKQDIIDWLKSKGETFDRPLLRHIMLERVRKIKPKFSAYVIDSIAQNAGHTILRLPPIHREFNPIQLAWLEVKQYVKQFNTTSKLTDVKHLLNESISYITSEHWSNFIKCVIKKEDYIWEVDKIMDEIIDNMEPM